MAKTQRSFLGWSEPHLSHWDGTSAHRTLTIEQLPTRSPVARLVYMGRYSILSMRTARTAIPSCVI